MPSQQKLVDALERYQEYEEYAQKLRHLIEEDDELEIIMPGTAEAILIAIEYAIGKRIHDVSEQLERIQNEPLQRFIRREVS